MSVISSGQALEHVPRPAAHYGDQITTDTLLTPIKFPVVSLSAQV